MLVGGLAIIITQKIIRSADYRVVRYATFAFWLAILLLALVMGIKLEGVSLNIIGGIAFIAGFGAGLWIDELA